MALTEYDKKNLSASDQKKIQAATDRWNAANAKGDKAGMDAAAKEAAAVRNNAGYKTDSWGNYTGSYSSGGSSGGSSSGTKTNSQYTAPVLGDTWDAKTDYQLIINTAEAYGDYKTAAKAEQLRNQKILSQGLTQWDTTNKYGDWLYSEWLKENNLQNALNNTNQWNDDYDDDNPRYDYDSDNAAKINAKLAEILNRDNFSYNVADDPLYQQYAEMYQREGDRAMRDTLAEVAASAGGMNSYAITAAQQANSYYNSQLNDKVPELYQLAYQMYLNELEGKVQDLGILQDMDATQYNRYRDTINDWYADKQFAYGMYQDAVNQGNIQTTMDNNNYWANKEFEYNDMWANKEYTDYRADVEYNRTQSERESAEEQIRWLIEQGVTPRADLIAKAEMTEEEVAQLIESVKAQYLANGIVLPNSTSYGLNTGTVYGGYTGGSTGGSTGGGTATLTGNTPEELSAYINENNSEDMVFVNGYGLIPYESYLYLAENGLITKPKVSYEDTTTSSSSTSNGSSSKDKTNTKPLSNKYSPMVLPTVDEDVEDIYATQGKEVANNALDEALVTGVITMSDYMKLKNKYRN